MRCSNLQQITNEMLPILKLNKWDVRILRSNKWDVRVMSKSQMRCSHVVNVTNEMFYTSKSNKWDARSHKWDVIGWTTFFEMFHMPKLHKWDVWGVCHDTNEMFACSWSCQQPSENRPFPRGTRHVSIRGRSRLGSRVWHWVWLCVRGRGGGIICWEQDCGKEHMTSIVNFSWNYNRSRMEWGYSRYFFIFSL